MPCWRGLHDRAEWNQRHHGRPRVLGCLSRREGPVLIDFVPDGSLYPFESRWFDSSVGRVHYIDEGAGPLLLLCHGAPTWSFLYRHIVKDLRDRYRCIAV